jgi:hypothetical protein
VTPESPDLGAPAAVRYHVSADQNA